MKRKYTFEDWENGIFKEDPFYLYDDGLMKKIELKKIRGAQERTFDEALQISFESYKKLFNQEIKRADNKDLYINIEIRKRETFLEGDSRYYQEAIAGRKYFTYITPEDYKKIKIDRKEHLQFDNKTILPGFNEDPLRKNFRFHVYYKTLKWLRSLKEVPIKDDNYDKIVKYLRPYKEYGFFEDGGYKGYYTFVDLLTKFFNGVTYTLPDKKIPLRRDTKAKIIRALNPIQKNCSTKKLTQENEDFFNIIRVLEPYKDIISNERLISLIQKKS